MPVNLEPEAKVFAVNDLQLAAQRWHNGDSYQILCLHGWLDNSESFSMLAPLLTNSDVVAFDMAGHGMSSHRSAHGSYNIWDDFIDIQAITRALGWQKYYLLGHSRGAIASFLYTAAMPDAVNGVMLLDGLLPPVQSQRTPAQQLNRFLLQRERQINKPLRFFSSLDTALESRAMLNDVDREAAMRMVQRDLVETNKGYCYRHDARLKAASAVRFGPDQEDQFLQDLNKRCLLLAAEHGDLNSAATLARLAHYPLIDLQAVNGCHHFHLQKKLLPETASKLLEWLEK
jgi:pimeloyl-ACP methyl ester carboxylesterase